MIYNKNIKPKILVIDDEENLRYTIGKFLSLDGYEVDTAGTYDEGLDKLSETDFDLIFADIILGIKTGIDILREAKQRNLLCPVVLITGYPNIETATEAVREGAYDYIPKPVKKDTILRTAKMALYHKSVIDENQKYQSNLEAIFRSVKDAIITVDEELIVLETNKAFEDICGLPCEDVKGKPINSLNFYCKEKFIDALTETIKTKKPVEIYRSECERQHGRSSIVNLSTYPLINRQGKFYGCVMVIKDETLLVKLESDLQERKQFHNIIGISDKMQKIYSLIENLSNIQTIVLITGESGTGKELVAEALHYKGERGKKPLVKVDCAALSDNLLESELFGHVKGAFTGAISNRIGRFQKADGGTIFLDEIGDISYKMQLNLLRILQDSKFERVGDSNPIKVDVRVIAATNQDLRKKVKSGNFREDLYHRLMVVKLSLPPLRERREDIPLLVDFFLKKLNKKLNKDVKAVSGDVQKIFMNYSWPGNIRELQHTLEFALVLCQQSTITINDLPQEFKDSNKTAILISTKKKSNNQEAIVQALEKTGWNKAKAARLLGIDRKTIYIKIKKYNIVENETS